MKTNYKYVSTISKVLFIALTLSATLSLSAQITPAQGKSGQVSGTPASVDQKPSEDSQVSDASSYEPQDIADAFVRNAVTLQDMELRAKYHPYMPGEIVVAMELGTSKANAATLLDQFNWQGLFAQQGVELNSVLMKADRGNFRSIALVLLSLPEGTEVFEAMKKLEGKSGVLWSSPNFYFEGDPREFVPNDPDYALQYHHPLMSNHLAWDITLGSSSIIVGITDDGVELTHSDLAPNIWINTGEIPGNGIDDDGNGYIDDVNGWDFSSGNNDPNPNVLGDTHGTHVAGITAARTDNSIGIAGVAGHSTIMPLQFYAGGPWTAAVINETFTYAADNGAKIVNTSYNIDGWVGDPVFTAGLQYLYDAGVLHLNSAGNNNQLNPPRQAFQQTLLVASTDAADMKSSFSNYGAGIDISAPGSSIYATVTGNSYNYLSGTSMAAPNAAGAAALIWSANPTWTRDQVAAQLLATADNIDAANPTLVGLLGSGRVNSYAALTSVPAAPQVKSIAGLPDEGTALPAGSLSTINVAFDQVMSPASVNDPANFELRWAGLNGSFGDADDELIALTTDQIYMVGTNQMTFHISNIELECGNYRFTIVSGGLENPFGADLDGDGNGTGGDHYVRNFSVETFYYLDEDGDGYGAGTAVAVCPPPPGYVLLDGDCDDNDPLINPGATEVCDGVDNNCDGIVDFPSVFTYASSDVPVAISSSGTPTVTSALTINGVTGDIIDLNVKDLNIQHTWVGDLKVTLTSPGGTVFNLFDRPGRINSGLGCSQNNILVTFDDEAVLTANDFENTCNSSNSAATYAISGTYQSIDPLVGLIGTDPNGTWILTISDFVDADGGSLEGWGLEISVPTATNMYYADADGDSYGDPNVSLELGCTPDPLLGWVLDNTDCDDTNPDINPAAAEVCDGVDNNCDGQIDEGNVCCPSGEILFVDAGATGLNNGTSWTDAFSDLQDALNSTCPGITEIWVAAGTYYPTSGTDRSISFVMKNNLVIYGGFDGTEDPLTFDLADRDFVANETILSGDIGTTGDFSDNSFHVVSNFNNSLDHTAILDGFTISGGNADGPNPNNIGGGMRNGGSSPLVSNCLFVGNSASYSGGGMSNFSASPTVINCAFIGNFSNQYGGGMQNDNNCSTTVINCSFSGNSAGIEGGAMDNFNNCNTTIGNSIFWGNSSEITNTGNSFLVIDNSIIEDGCPGINATCNDVIAQNPLFMHQPSIGLGASGDLSLQDCSPALDTGDDTFNTTTSDLSGNPRKFDAIPGGSLIDMGAYERKQVAFNGSILYVNHTATGANSGTSWDDAFTTLSEAMLQSCPNVAQIWVAAGTYYPTSDTDRNISFVLKNGIAVYGGFDGTEDPLTFDLADRDFVANETILSGEIGDQGTTADNSYTVVSGTGTNATAILDGFTITAGNANAGGGTVPDSRGGGMFIGDNSSPIISNCKFYLNSADFGGGIYNRNNTATVFTECSFISNSATHWGGAMLNESENSIILEECTFQGNTANFGGGIFSRFNTMLTLTNCLFEENSSTSTGGAIYTESDLIMDNCAFNQNSSSFAGGAIYNYSNNATITSSSFTENYALYVGGAIMTHAPAGQDVNISVSESSFQSNTTTYGGGAVNHGYANSEGAGLFECSNCTFTNNVAFDGNTLGGGGAFFNEAIGFDGLFTNCLFDGNKGLGTEDWGGGTFLIFEGNCTIINSTIVNSESATVGGAISVWSENSTLELFNTILWDNTAASNNSIFNGNGGTANVEYSLIQEDACPANVNCGSGMLFGVDPLFVSPADFHLQACSPAINAGNNALAPGDDLDGNLRPFDPFGFGAVVDMGAYEFSVITDYCDVCEAVAGTLTKNPDEEMVCEGSDVSATLSGGLYGNGTDELEFRTYDGTAWSAWAEYTSGTAISTAGIAEVEIRTRRLSDHCDPSEYQTIGWLVQWPPVAFAGQDASILPGDNYSLSDATATGNSSILWETSGDGSFDDDYAQNPTYTPGTNDKLTGSVELSISLEDMNLCGFTDSDQMTLTIYRPPTIEITSPFDGDVFYDNPVSAQGTAADPDGDLTEVYLRVNNGLWAPATGTDNWTMDLALEAGENLIQAKAVDAQGLESAISEVTVIMSIQIISIPQGWSLISSYLTPNDPALEMLMQDVSIPENLTIMLGLNGIFWPGYGINTIGNWNILEGYKVKYQQPVELTIRGNKLNDNSVTFPAGFHYIPVLSNVPSPVSEVFSDPANDLKYMFDITSGQIYWPMGGIQTLTTLFPGKGYLANFNKQVTLNFPEYQALKSSTVAANFVSGQDGPWTYAKTGEVHFISLGAQAIDALEQYAYIGAFKSDGSCIGLADITTKGHNILLPVYGNDPYTGIKAGAEEGEPITFKAWNPADGLATELVVVFDPSFPNHDGSFAINGLSAVLDFKENSTGIGVPALISQISMYPNPANDHVNISINGNDLEVNYSIMDMEGRLIQKSEFTGDEFRLDVSNFKPGLYMIRFEIEGEVFVRRIMVM